MSHQGPHLNSPLLGYLKDVANPMFRFHLRKPEYDVQYDEVINVRSEATGQVFTTTRWILFCMGLIEGQ